MARTTRKTNKIGRNVYIDSEVIRITKDIKAAEELNKASGGFWSRLTLRPISRENLALAVSVSTISLCMPELIKRWNKRNKLLKLTLRRQKKAKRNVR